MQWLLPSKVIDARIRSYSAYTMTGPTVADLLSTSVREREAPHELIELLRRLPSCFPSQQQLLAEAQGVEVLVHLLQHKEPAVRLEACLALTSVQVPSNHQQQATNAEPLVAALAGLLYSSKQPSRTSRSTSTSTTQGNIRPGSSSKANTTPPASHSTPTGPTCWEDVPRLAAAAFCSCADPGALQEVCRTRPDLLATLPQLLVDTVEGALHEQVAQQQAVVPGQQAAGPKQQQPWQLPAACAAMGGLLQLLYCGSQQVHCAVVRHLCRLAYCTCVLEQLGVGLAAYPGAVAAVVALVQPWSQEGFAAATDGVTSNDTSSNTITSATTSSSSSSSSNLEGSCGATDPTADSSTPTSTPNPTSTITLSKGRSIHSTAATTTTTSSSSSSSSRLWPGGAPQLQAEAAASLLVLSSLGSGARELVAQESNAVRGLLLALSGATWQAVQEVQREEAAAKQMQATQQQQQQQQAEAPSLPQLFATLRHTVTLGNLSTRHMRYVVSSVFWFMMLWLTGLFQLVLHWRALMLVTKDMIANIRNNGGWSLVKSLWMVLSCAIPCYAWRCVCSATSLGLGVCVELLVWTIATPILAVKHACTPLVVLLHAQYVIWSLATPSSHHQWVRLRQQWAAYCLWHLLCDARPSRSMWQQHATLAKQVFLGFLATMSTACPCAVHFVVELGVLSGWTKADRRPAAELKCIEPPPPPHLPGTWRYRLDAFARAALAQAAADMEKHLLPALVVGSLVPVTGAGAAGLARLPYLQHLHYFAVMTPIIFGCILCPAAAGVFAAGIQATLAAAAALVVTASSQLGSYQVVVATRPAPAAAPPRTWLQPVTYLALDLSYSLRQEVSGTSLGKYSQFGGWPPAAPFHPSPCGAQHTAQARQMWLNALSTVQGTFLAYTVVEVIWQWWFPTSITAWAVQYLLGAADRPSLLWWLCSLMVTLLQMSFQGMQVVGALLALSCAVLQPSHSPTRRCVLLCWWWLRVACTTAARQLRGAACACGHALVSMAAALLSLWGSTKAYLGAVAAGGALASGVVGRRVGWLVQLPVWLVSTGQGAWLAGHATSTHSVEPWVAPSGRACSAQRAEHSSSVPHVQGPGGSTRAASPPRGKQNGKASGKPARSPQQQQRASATPVKAAAAAEQQELGHSPAVAAPSASTTGGVGVGGNSEHGWGIGDKARAVGQTGLQAGTAAAAAAGPTCSSASSSCTASGGTVLAEAAGSTAPTASSAATGRGREPATSSPLPTPTPPVTPRSTTGDMLSTGQGADTLQANRAPATAPAPETAPSSGSSHQTTHCAVGRDTGTASAMKAPTTLSSSSRISGISGQRPTPLSISDDGNSSHSSSSPSAPDTPAVTEAQPALAATQQAAQDAARAAAAAAAAAGRPVQEVHLAAARAAAEALQGVTAGMAFVEGSLLVAHTAAAAVDLYAAGPTSTAAAAAAAGHPVAAAVAGNTSLSLSTAPAAAPSPAAAAAGAAGSGITMADTGPAPAAAGHTAPRRTRKAKVRNECVVCLDARPCVTTHPCGHRVLCGGCAQLVAASKGECPMCRAAVVRYEAGAGRM